MPQSEAIQLTSLFVIDLIRRLNPGHPVSMGDLAEELSRAIVAPAEGELWFTFGPHSSLQDFLLELQALGEVTISGNPEAVRVTVEGEHLLQASANELPGLSARLGLAA